MACMGPTLGMNQALHPGDYLETGGGLFVALMQVDGNLVVYPGTDAIALAPTQEQGAVWSSNSYNDIGQCVALMQSDGNFAIYPTPDAVGKAPTEQTGAIWATNTSGASGGPNFFVALLTWRRRAEGDYIPIGFSFFNYVQFSGVFRWIG